MSADSHDQYVFGTQPANGVVGGSGALLVGRSTPSSTRTGPVTPVGEVPADDELSRLCDRVADALPPTARTAVVLVDQPRQTRQGEPPAPAIATSSASTTAVVRIEWLLHEGPVRASLESREAIVSSRLADDRRWPRFARAVPAHDAVSAAAVPILLPGELGAGVLAAYSQVEDAFDPRDVRVLAAFARVVADLAARTRREAPTTAPVDPDTTRLVNQAVGVLITHDCDEEQALRRLQRISESTRLPLGAAAQMIVDEARTEAHLRFVERAPRLRLQHL